MERLVGVELRLDADAGDARDDAVADDDAPLGAVGLRAVDLGDHDVESGPERTVEPAVGEDVLPVARAPGMVPQAIAVDLGRFAVDRQAAGNAHVLLVVRAAEALCFVLVRRVAAS